MKKVFLTTLLMSTVTCISTPGFAGFKAFKEIHARHVEQARRDADRAAQERRDAEQERYDADRVEHGRHAEQERRDADRAEHGRHAEQERRDADRAEQERYDVDRAAPADILARREDALERREAVLERGEDILARREDALKAREDALERREAAARANALQAAVRVAPQAPVLHGAPEVYDDEQVAPQGGMYGRVWGAAQEEYKRMPNFGGKADVGNWTETFKTRVGDIKHTPTFINLGGWMQAENRINMNSQSFNGVPLKAPLILEQNSTREDFIAAMKAAGIY